jgi:predicted nuclease of predicted toxin-antitoxin system
MTRPRFLADQDFNEHILRGVTRREPTVEFIKLREIGLQEEDDPTVLAYAAANGLIVISHDVTTMSAHARARIEAGQPMHGMFLVLQTTPIRPVIESLIVISVASEAEEWINQIRYLPL